LSTSRNREQHITLTRFIIANQVNVNHMPKAFKTNKFLFMTTEAKRRKATLPQKIL